MSKSELQNTYLIKWARAERQLALNWNLKAHSHIHHIAVSPESHHDTVEPTKTKNKNYQENSP